MQKNEKVLFGFIDESGTAGVSNNINDYLVVSMVLFYDKGEMKSVHEKFDELRCELGRGKTYEFHYAHNKRYTRGKVFEIISKTDFRFITFAIKKDGVKNHASYSNLAEMVMTRLTKEGHRARIVIDVNPVFFRELNKIKKKKKNKNVRFQQNDSDVDDCLQLVDYVVGAHSRVLKEGKEGNFKYIRSKMESVQIVSYN